MTPSEAISGRTPDIPIIPNKATREQLFPVASRVVGQRIFRLDLLAAEQWDGRAWQREHDRGSNQPPTQSNIEFNVLDYAAPGTTITDGVTDGTAAFERAFAAAALVSGVVRVPPGAYTISRLVWPNARVVMHGTGVAATTITITGSVGGSAGPVGVYVGHNGDQNHSRFSQIHNLTLQAAPHNSDITVLRINNLGTILEHVWCRGGRIGIEANSMVSTTWDNVTSYGSAYGIALRNALTDASKNDTLWMNHFRELSTSTPGARATGCYIGSNVGYSTFEHLDAEQCGTGIRCIAGGVGENTFINAWVEFATEHWYDEDPGCANLYVQPYWRTTDRASNRWGTKTTHVRAGSISTPAGSGNANIGLLQQESRAAFQILGVNTWEETSSAKRRTLWPVNKSTHQSANARAVDEQTFLLDSSGSASGADLFTVTVSDRDCAGYLEFEITSFKGGVPANHAYFRGVRRFLNASGRFTFATVGTDDESRITLTLSQVDTYAFRISVQWSDTNARVAGSVRVFGGVGAADGMGVTLKYTGP